MRNILIKISIIRIISARRLKSEKEKTANFAEYSLRHLLVYRFNTSILMEEALSLGALTTAAKRANFFFFNSIKLIARSLQR